MQGINFASAAHPGQLSYCYGLSTRSFPYLTTRKGDRRIPQHNNVIGMTVFQGQIVTVVKSESGDTSELRVNGLPQLILLGTIERQFVSINTKLVIFPDAICLENNQGTITLRRLSPTYNISAGSFSKTSITTSQIDEMRASGMGGKLENAVFSINSYEETTLNGNFYINKAGELRILRELELDPQQTSTVTIYNESDALGSVSFYLTDSFFERYYPQYHQGVKTVVLANGKLYEEDADGWGRRGKELFFSFPNYRHQGETKSTYNVEAIYWIDEENEGEFLDGNIINFLSFQRMIGRNVTIKTSSDIDALDFCGLLENVEGGALQLDLYSSLQTNTVCKGYVQLNFEGWASTLNSFLVPGDEIWFSNLPDRIFTVDAVAPCSIVLSDADLETYFDSQTIPIEIYRKVGDNNFDEIKIGDTVEITGCVNTTNNITFIVENVQGNTICAAEDVFSEGEEETFTIRRKMPQLDFVCEKDNRLFGVSNTDKTIYVSALGDPTSYFIYSGLSTDSFSVAVGGEGNFVACNKYSDSVLFWKKNKLYKLIGSSPSDFAIYSYDVDGVDEHAHKSIQIINETLYYKGSCGVYAYNGAVPALISECFGEKRFTDAVAGTDGRYYYLSATDVANGQSYLLSYDTRTGLWLIEERIKCLDFARTSDGLYYATEDGVYKMGEESRGTKFEWLARWAPIYELINGKRSYSRILMRVSLPRGSYITVKIRCDGGAWQEAGKIIGRTENVVPITIPINRCDKFELELSGNGECTILDIMREYHVGSEI